jgi:prolyl-tRNA editing enzyme YbaK/EbsC (Cys-tRNA(Pro) deacylase)
MHSQKPYEAKLKDFIRQHSLEAKHLSFEVSCHSVAEAAQAVGADPTDLVKNICLIGADGQLIVAIVKGEDRVSASRSARALDLEGARPATETEILEMTGYPCGGTPSFGFPAAFLVDARVMEKSEVFTGGGSEYSLVKISPVELLKANQALVARVRR